MIADLYFYLAVLPSLRRDNECILVNSFPNIDCLEDDPLLSLAEFNL
jgi:hypothetical protein